MPTPARWSPSSASNSPQTVAVLLAHMRPEDAARIMAELPGEFRTKVARRIAQLDRVDPAAVAPDDSAH